MRRRSALRRLVALSGLPVVWPSAATRQTPDPLRFRLAIGALAGSSRRFVPITGDLTLASGDELKLFVSPVTRCFVYLLVHDSHNEITLLFPYTLRQFESDYRAGERYYIPAGRDWLKLDDRTGRETIHVVASSVRLTKLEGLLATHDAADTTQRAPMVRSILDEIRALRRLRLSARAERPIPIGGTTRAPAPAGVRPDVALSAVEISAPAFYAKAFTIDHR